MQSWQVSEARYLLDKREYEFWSRSNEQGQQASMADSIQPILAACLAELVAMDHVPSAEVALCPTPGHTPGHLSVTIDSPPPGQRAVYGDTSANRAPAVVYTLR